jgi:hypothetical protein
MPTPRTDYDFDVITGPSTPLPSPQPAATPPSAEPPRGGEARPAGALNRG